MAGVSATSEAFARLVAGEEPDTLSYDTLSFSGLSVKGASNGTTSYDIAEDGTALSVYDPNAFETVTVAGSPVEAISTGVAYGSVQVLPGARTYTVTDAHAQDPSDTANVRYSCGGWVASNATARVASGEDGNASFTVEKGKGPYTLTWQWVDRETRTVVTPAPAFGVIQQNGTPVATVTEFWVRDDATLTLDAVPEGGCALTKWQGAPRGSERTNALVLSGDESHAVTAYFHDSASSTTRYWKKGATGSFYTAANWVGGVVPGYGDTVVVSNGTCTATEYLQLAGLVVTNGGQMVISGADIVSVAGDLTLGGTAALTVQARATDSTHTFATGVARVTVGGTLRIAESAVLYPKSDQLTGGSVRFDVHNFLLASGASVNADNCGWAWVTYTGTPAAGANLYSDNGVKYQTFALGCGWSYGTGGNYGYPTTTSCSSPYGWENAPVHPGSPNGIYSNSTYPGGGLVRIHAYGRIVIEGTVTADGISGSVFGGPSGGGIWLTARQFSFGETAILRARGGTANYSSNGGGGRIAIGRVIDGTRLTDLAKSGEYKRMREENVHDEEWFRANVGNASMTINVHSRPNSSQKDKPGTFAFIDGLYKGFAIIVR